ncbi:hypothetical protein ACILE9_10285 [Capnocytophaga cynodegmi]|uniref:hypothetical protein n=1 Tax=Capnocytophaga cynodegmi TaxID=28189 RepID=UPI0037D7914C
MRKDFRLEHLDLEISNIFSIFDLLLEEKFSKKDFESILHHAKVQLSNIYDLRPQDREDVYEQLLLCRKNIEEIFRREELSLITQRRESLLVLNNVIDEIFKKTVTFGTKLKINASQAVIIDLIRQLKNICIKEKEPFLPQTNAEIAEFLFYHIEGFEKSSITTITTELGRSKEIKKTKIKVQKMN